MWLERQFNNINRPSGPIIISSNFNDDAIIFGAIRDKFENVVWLEITDKEKDDPVALGNILSDAVKRALGSKLFDYGLPYSYGLKVLENQLELLGPFYFLVSRAGNNTKFAQDILKLNKVNSKVVLSFCPNKLLNKLADNILNIPEDELLLKEEEAKDLAGKLVDEDFKQIWEESNGKYLVFLNSLNRLLNTPAPIIPSPGSNRLLNENAYEVDPNLLLNVLIKKERWLDVLEVAVPLLPNRVPEIIVKAGYHYNELGQTKRLWELLSELPRAIKLQEDVLFWLLSSAFWQGKAEELRADVEEHLKNNEAAELRALYAGILAALENRLREARAAYKVKQTSFTSYMLGSFEEDISKRIELMQYSVELAEMTKQSYDIVRNATGLVRILTHMGNYEDALFWSEWAQEQAEKFQLKNDTLRLWLISHWAYLCTILGERENIFNQLSKEVDNLQGVALHLEIVFRENLGDYLLSSGDVDAALELYEKNWKIGTRQYIGRGAFNLVKAYLWLGNYKKAFKIISQAKALISEELVIQRNYLDLAFACAMVMVSKEKGIEYLLKLKNSNSFGNWKSELKFHHALYLAFGYIETDRISQAKEILGDCNGISKFPNTGLLVFAGPEEKFKQVWSLVDSKSYKLDLRFVEEKDSFWYQNKEIKLTLQEKEIVVILVSNPQGLSIEQLGLMLSYDSIGFGRIKSAITRLRKKIPISKDTYRITTDFSADFLEIINLSNIGQLRKVIDMYRQPLLEESDSGEVIRIREILNQTVRQAVLLSNDTEVIMDFAKNTTDDLESWERLLLVLSENDSRIPYVKARIEQITKDW